ncbi:MAG: hypothetical protein ACOZBL_04350 [Patescibacteria group bacterium]
MEILFKTISVVFAHFNIRFHVNIISQSLYNSIHSSVQSKYTSEIFNQKLDQKNITANKHR